MDTTMQVFVDTAFGIWFSIGVDLWDTVLTMKQKIEKFQRIPVSKQTLYFDSKVLDDHLDIEQCKIFNNSRLFLEISPDYNPSQNNDQLPYQTEPPNQTEQSPTEPSEQSNEFVNPQAWPVMVRSNNDQVLPQTEPSLLTADSVEEFLMNQGSPEMMEGKNNQLLHQNEQFSIPSNSFGETIYSQDQALSDISKILGLGKTEEKIHGQYSPVMMDGRNSQVLHQNEQLSVPSYSIGETIYSQDQALSDISKIKRFELGKGKEKIHGQYSPVMTEGRNSQVLHQKEQFSVPSNSFGEAIYSQDRALAIDDISSKSQRFDSVNTQEIIHGQYEPVVLKNITNISLPPNYSEEFLVFKDQPSVPVGNNSSNKNESLPSNSSQELRGTQDLRSRPVGSSSRNKNKGIKTKQPPKPVSVKRIIINTPDSPERKRRKRSPVKYTVMVQPFQKTTKIPVYVNSDEKVEELRIRLVKLQEMGVLALPEEGYFFIHKQDVLTDHQTFEENLVAPGDTIEIFRGTVTYDGSVPPRTRMSR